MIKLIGRTMLKGINILIKPLGLEVPRLYCTGCLKIECKNFNGYNECKGYKK